MTRFALLTSYESELNWTCEATERKLAALGLSEAVAKASLFTHQREAYLASLSWTCDQAEMRLSVKVWCTRPTIKISLDSLSGFLRSNLPADSRSSHQSSAQSAKVPDKIRFQNLHFRPRIGLFLHFRPSYAIFGSALAQPFEREILSSWPTYGFFGGQLML
jgi:hypothetical protein